MTVLVTVFTKLQMTSTEETVNEDETKLVSISKLRKQIQQIKDVGILENANLDDIYLLRFLYSTSFNIDEAFKRFKGYHESVQKYPLLYPLTGPLDRRPIIERNISTLLPDCDRKGRPIYIFKPGNANYSQMKFSDQSGIDDNLFEYLLVHNPEIAEKGICYILDAKDHSYGFVRWLSITNMNMGLNKLNYLPFKDFMCHVVNQSNILKITTKMIWPLIPESSKKNVRIHADCSCLHEYIDPEVLPPEYGGNKEIDYESIHKSYYDKHDDIVKSYSNIRQRSGKLK
ncbi:retinaldehyde-binding protein 1-like isoform X1 [Diabrotica virgifera virgifera]|uniref:CRAL-TRIO domain-containing protein n=2 Tax=Diabrotica virgifera virgifera TaxID=50390 RepID=A0ABM5KSW2_DIAVI|nr:retinaldehyde-binding protein 1-like isoform X1 [Diabrotica virgifera virgifera]